MTRFKTALWAGLCAGALVFGACSQNAVPDADTGVNDAAETVSSDTTERPSREELLAKFEEAMTKAQSTNGPGAPVLWTMADEDTTIHFFGTVHILRPDIEWRSERFETLFAASDKVVFEVDMKSEAAQRAVMTDFLARGMYDDGRNLRGVLNERDEAVVEAAFDGLGIPMDAMNAFEPWMAAVNLSVMQLQNSGWDVNSGVEQVLEEEAVAAGKTFGYLESISDQADAFDLLPEEDQIAFLYETAILLEDSPSMLDGLVSEWAEGDIAGLAALVASPEALGMGDAAYESLLVKRNKNWIPVIEDMLNNEQGTIFIAVGSGHLAGPDSVITMLRDKGYEVTGP